MTNCHWKARYEGSASVKRVGYTLLVAVLLLALGACAGAPVASTPQAISGSKSDGTIRLAYDVIGSGSASVNWQAAEQNALRRCQAWGYSRVDAFAGGTERCTEVGRGLLINGGVPGVCVRKTFTKDYQCLD